jgi:hypothetical protein
MFARRLASLTGSAGCWLMWRNSARRKYVSSFAFSVFSYFPQAYGVGTKSGDTAWIALRDSNSPSHILRPVSPRVTTYNIYRSPTILICGTYLEEVVLGASGRKSGHYFDSLSPQRLSVVQCMEHFRSWNWQR